MAVFTPVTLSQLTPWLEQFDLGNVSDLRGISAGIENSNFFLSTYKNHQIQEYVLTLFERLSYAQLPFYLHLMQHLSAHHIPVPCPVANNIGQIINPLNDKPAVIVNKLPGKIILNPHASHCQQIGTMLAKLHLAGQSYALKQENLRSLSWWEQTIPMVLPYLTSTQHTLIYNELSFQQRFFASEEYITLPAGPTHCDLFRDNVLFDTVNGSDQLSGFFDFYFAACDKWLFDLAVTVNDWCLNHENKVLDSQKANALLSAYHAVRPFTETEKSCWPTMLRTAALRFWVSRLWDFYLPRNAQTLTPLDPQHFEHILQHLIATKTTPWIN